MPTYEYECSKCGAIFEAFQTMTAPPLKKCRECGAKGTVSRLVGSGAGLIFKGSGFYATDYKRAGQSRTETPETAGGEKKSESADKGEKPKKGAAAGKSSSSSSSSKDT